MVKFNVASNKIAVSIQKSEIFHFQSWRFFKDLFSFAKLSNKI